MPSTNALRGTEAMGMSKSRRPMIECIFGWGKQHPTMRKTKHRSISRVAADFMLNLIAYNLIRIPKLVAGRRATVQNVKRPSKNRTHHERHGPSTESKASIFQVFQRTAREERGCTCAKRCPLSSS